jgi:6-phosphogluconolactonase
MNLREYPDRDLMMMAVADALASDLRSCVAHHDFASFAVPGGTTPGPIFDTLSAVDIDWSRVHVMLTDERWVPEDSPRSNTKLVRDRLLTGHAAAAEYVALYTGDPTPEDAVPTLTPRLEAELPLSLLLLGMGADMHIASLFPGADGLAAALADDAPPALPIRADAAGEPRITLTAPVLRGAMSTHIVITGAQKREVLDQARRLRDPLLAPVMLVLNTATVHWAE